VFVAARKGDFGVEPLLSQLGVAPSTFCGWLEQDRDPSPHRREDVEVLAGIRDVHDRWGQTYGVPRVHATGRRRGRRVSRKRVERLMHAAGPQGA
jgi:putative transposase